MPIKSILFQNRICLLVHQIDENEYRILYDQKIINVFKCHNRDNSEAWGQIKISKYEKLWVLNGRLHREDGPAYIQKDWDDQDIVVHSEYWLYGYYFPKEEYYGSSSIKSQSS